MSLTREHASTAPAPWNRRIAEFAGLAIAASVLMQFCWTILGISDNVCVVMLAVACISDPVLRLLEARRSGCDVRATRGTVTTAVVACAPAIVLGWLHEFYPSAPAWHSAAVPSAVRYTGCLLAFAVIVLRPALERTAGASDDVELHVPPITVSSQLLIVGLLLVSFSATTVGLTLYWLTALGAQRLAPSLSVMNETLKTVVFGIPGPEPAGNASLAAK